VTSRSTTSRWWYGVAALIVLVAIVFLMPDPRPPTTTRTSETPVLPEQEIEEVPEEELVITLAEGSRDSFVGNGDVQRATLLIPGTLRVPDGRHVVTFRNEGRTPELIQLSAPRAGTVVGDRSTHSERDVTYQDVLANERYSFVIPPDESVAVTFIIAAGDEIQVTCIWSGCRSTVATQKRLVREEF
jgi:hypothetical protein